MIVLGGNAEQFRSPRSVCGFKLQVQHFGCSLSLMVWASPFLLVVPERDRSADRKDAKKKASCPFR